MKKIKHTLLGIIFSLLTTSSLYAQIGINTDDIPKDVKLRVNGKLRVDNVKTIAPENNPDINISEENQNTNNSTPNGGSLLFWKNSNGTDGDKVIIKGSEGKSFYKLKYTFKLPYSQDPNQYYGIIYNTKIPTEVYNVMAVNSTIYVKYEGEKDPQITPIDMLYRNRDDNRHSRKDLSQFAAPIKYIDINKCDSSLVDKFESKDYCIMANVGYAKLNYFQDKFNKKIENVIWEIEFVAANKRVAESTPRNQGYNYNN